MGARHECVRWGWPLAAGLALTLGETPTVEELLNVLDARPDGHLPPFCAQSANSSEPTASHPKQP